MNDLFSTECQTRSGSSRRIYEIISSTPGKSLQTVLISVAQEPSTDEAFTDLNVSNNAKDFFYVDAVAILETLGLDKELIEIMKAPLEEEKDE